MGGVLLFANSCTTQRIDKYDFNPTMSWNKKYTKNIAMHGDRERIMFFTDFHFHGAPDEAINEADRKTITKEVQDYQPDLIIVLGDSIDDHSNPQGLPPERWYENQETYVRFMDTLKTPWAPIFGNHETAMGHTDSMYAQHSKPKLAELFALSKYCLFQWGPKNFPDGQTGGAGNYCINLTKDSKIVHSFILMDTCQGSDSDINYYTDVKQIAWYQWMQKGLISVKNKDPNWTTTLCTHVPFRSIDDFNEDGDTDKCHYLYGKKEEDTYPQIQNADEFYNAILSTKVVDQIISGHDHTNDYSFYHKIDHIRLTYAVKSARAFYGDTSSSKDYDPSMLGFLGMSITAKNESYQANYLRNFE